jgi:1-acyl-sn-glycerol-3-phosphate acyltransferase
MMSFLRFLIFQLSVAVGTILFGGSCIVAALLRVPDGPHSTYALAPRRWGRFALWMAGIRVQEHGVEHKQGAGHIFVANHLSILDVLALGGHLPWIKFVAKAELFRVPILGPSMRHAGMIPIERANRKAAFGAYTTATERIRAGASVGVYPEGTRGRAYPLRPFKRGPFVLAIQAQVPVVPMFVYGVLELAPRGTFQVYPGTIHLHYLPPIPTAGLTHDDRDALAKRTYEAMATCARERYGVVSPPYGSA